jgi:hypothetical protein
VKNLLWDEILKHFTLPEGVEPTNVKRWTLTRMATQFQKFNQQLDKDYIKKNRTPNWIEYPKLKEHWMSFVEYKKSEDFTKVSARGKQSRGKKEHDHHLGRGGYAFAISKWRKMEEDLLAQGTIVGDSRIGWNPRTYVKRNSRIYARRNLRTRRQEISENLTSSSTVLPPFTHVLTVNFRQPRVLVIHWFRL